MSTNTANITTTWHGDQERKAKMVAAMEEHRRIGRIKQGALGNNKSGGAVACAYQSVVGWRGAFSYVGLSEHLGVDQWLTYLVDQIFDGLSADDAPTFACDWLAALPVGADARSIKSGVSALIVRLAAESARRAHGATHASRVVLADGRARAATIMAEQGVSLIALLERHAAGETLASDAVSAALARLSATRRAADAAAAATDAAASAYSSACADAYYLATTCAANAAAYAAYAAAYAAADDDAAVVGQAIVASRHQLYRSLMVGLIVLLTELKKER